MMGLLRAANCGRQARLPAYFPRPVFICSSPGTIPAFCDGFDALVFTFSAFGLRSSRFDFRCDLAIGAFLALRFQDAAKAFPKDHPFRSVEHPNKAIANFASGKPIKCILIVKRHRQTVFRPSCRNDVLLIWVCQPVFVRAPCHQLHTRAE